jgi:hypothetical protein
MVRHLLRRAKSAERRSDWREAIGCYEVRVRLPVGPTRSLPHARARFRLAGLQKLVGVFNEAKHEPRLVELRHRLSENVTPRALVRLSASPT